MTRASGCASGQGGCRARDFLSFTYPGIPSGAHECPVNSPFAAGPYKVTVGSYGELTSLKDMRTGLSRKVSIGLLEYEPSAERSR